MDIKFIQDNGILIIMALISGLLLLRKKSSHIHGASSLTPKDAVTHINRSRVIIVDVREQQSFALGHIPDARHIPLEAFNPLPATLAKYKQKPLLLYCQNGKQSAQACRQLQSAQFSAVYHLDGGLDAWQRDTLPVVN